MPEIVKQIQSVLSEFEGTVRERNKGKKKAAEAGGVKYMARDNVDPAKVTEGEVGYLLDNEDNGLEILYDKK